MIQELVSADRTNKHCYGMVYLFEELNSFEWNGHENVSETILLLFVSINIHIQLNMCINVEKTDLKFDRKLV